MVHSYCNLREFIHLCGWSLGIYAKHDVVAVWFNYIGGLKRNQFIEENSLITINFVKHQDVTIHWLSFYIFMYLFFIFMPPLHLASPIVFGVCYFLVHGMLLDLALLAVKSWSFLQRREWCWGFCLVHIFPPFKSQITMTFIYETEFVHLYLFLENLIRSFLHGIMTETDYECTMFC